MRVLLDEDVNKWNERLKSGPYRIKIPNYIQAYIDAIHGYVTSPTLSTYQSTNSFTDINFQTVSEIKEVNKPNIFYKFSFSVTKDRKDELFRIQSILMNRGIINESRFEGHKVDIHPKEVKPSITETVHRIYERDYIRYSYELSGSLLDIVAYVSILEDSIEFFQKIWGYSEDGIETCLIKYPIGSIVSPVNNRSKDCMVIDYQYVTKDGNYEIKFITSEIVSDKRSPIIKYGDTAIFEEKSITFSRNDRIDNIIN